MTTPLEIILLKAREQTQSNNGHTGKVRFNVSKEVKFEVKERDYPLTDSFIEIYSGKTLIGYLTRIGNRVEISYELIDGKKTPVRKPILGQQVLFDTYLENNVANLTNEEIRKLGRKYNRIVNLTPESLVYVSEESMHSQAYMDRMNFGRNKIREDLANEKKPKRKRGRPKKEPVTNEIPNSLGLKEDEKDDGEEE